jgi:hypothetical protein
MPGVVSHDRGICSRTQAYEIASVVNFYNATGSPARFENKNILVYFEKRSSLLQFDKTLAFLTQNKANYAKC